MDTTTQREQTRDYPDKELRTMALSNETDSQQDTSGPRIKRSGRRGLAWAVAALAALLVIAAIGFFVTRQGNEPTVAPSAAATVDAAASQAALDASWQATQDYYAAFDRASQAASLEGVDVAATAWPAEVDSVTQWVQTLSTGARHQTGDSVVSLISQEFVPSKDPATAADPAYGKVTQNICLDTSGVDLVDNATGQSLRAPAPGKTEIITRSPATITVERTGGVWKVSNEDVDYEATC